MWNPRIGSVCLALASMLAGCAHSPTTSPVLAISPKLEILDQQIKTHSKNAQAYSNRGYVLALLGQQEAARADLKKAVALNDNGPVH
ncbi:MAG TPA: hypothetical protein DCE44_24255, partial [Verrucomicrobiales bacterium]|nr:hypothetical protein [Verrucomicrobiales bacterium]